MESAYHQATVKLPAKIFGVISHTIATQFALHIVGLLFRSASPETSNQPLKLQEIIDAEVSACAAKHHLDIRSGEVGPLGRNGAKCAIVDLEQESDAVAVVALADADEELATERVERMGNTDKTRCWGGRPCILS